MDSGNTDSTCFVNNVAGEVLNVVEFSKISTVIGSLVRLKLAKCLSAEIIAIYQKENAFDSGKFDETVYAANSGMRFSAAGRHLN